MQSIAMETTVRASADHVSAELGGEIVILDLRQGEYYGLNAVGARIWALVQQERTVGEVRDILVGEYPDVEPERCTADVVQLFRRMVDAELIEVDIPSRR
jgi:hypothetical protein